MTKRYKILQKKLQELESSLSQLSSPDPAAAVPSHLFPELLDEIAQQLVFSKKLLSAEISSHPSKPHHLAHISRRLDQLDTTFLHFRDHHDRAHIDDQDVNYDFPVDGLDAASSCSCTESCLNDDGEGEADMGSELCEEPEMYYDVVAEEATVALGRRVETETVAEKWVLEKVLKEGDCVWDFYGVLGGGVVVGAVIGAAVMGFVMMRFSCCFHCIQHEGYLTPT